MTDNSEKKATSQAPTRRFNKMLVILIVILIGLVGLSIYMLMMNHQLKHQITHFHVDTQTLQRQEGENRTQLSLVNQHLQTLETDLQKAMQQRWFQNNDWLLLKARYYLELAAMNATWSSDNATTLNLLQQADLLLSNTHDPHITEIRQSIAEETTTLQGLPQVDKTGILSQIDAIAKKIPELSLKRNPEKKAPDKKASPALTWRQQFQQSLNQLKQLVIIRHHSEALEPFVNPAYETLVRESIRLNLQTAQWAVLEGNQVVYQSALTQAITHINQSFAGSDPAVEGLMKQLQALQIVTVSQSKIIPQHSLLLLNEWIESKHN